MRVRELLIPLVMLGTPAFGQCRGADVSPIESTTPPPEPPRAPDIIESVIQPTMTMTTNVAFVVDTSGSMDNDGRVGMALTFARGLIERPTDQLMIALLSFKDSHMRWPGLTAQEREAARIAGTLQAASSTPPPKGWTYFPGVPELASAQAWLTARGASGGTNPVSAIAEILSESVRDLTVVLITDGEDFDVPAFRLAVTAGQASRVQRGVGRAVIFVIGTGGAAANKQHLRDVGTSEGGGLHVIRRPAPPPPPQRAPQIPDLDMPWSRDD